jgi:predicted ATP-binding protein involved in virulence
MPECTTRMRIRTLHLENYRCFSDLKLDFHPKMNVLVASNGAGKTSVLDAIAVAFGPFISAFDEAKGKHFLGSDIQHRKVRVSESNEMESAPEGLKLSAEGEIEDAPVTWSRSLKSPVKAKTTIRDAKPLLEYGKLLQVAVRTPNSNVLMPLLAYYGTGRLWQQKKLTEEKKKIQRTSRTIGYTDCLDPASSYKSFLEWFRYWNLNAKSSKIKLLEEGKEIQPTEFDRFVQSVRKAVNTCLAPTGWKQIEYSFSDDALVAHHPVYGKLPVEFLSDGIRNMIGMVADIAFRATKLNPHLGENAGRQTPGIVLIDEVDMHLHPEWQQVVLGSLSEAFPELQFIVTTHSPQVLTSVDASSIRVLRQLQQTDSTYPLSLVERVDQQTKGVSSANVLAEIMGVNPVPLVPESKMVNEYQALIMQDLHETPEGVRLRASLEVHFGSGHPIIHECNRMIRLQDYRKRLPILKS